jgi:pimeloyl-ACP methyl ester carboxylesterase
MVTGEQVALGQVTSHDGTRIAYETWGQGPALIAVCGTTCDRALMRSTAQAFGEYFTTINYDRRGRGDSGDTGPYAVDREIEDIAALIEEAGGSAYLYGHSSGAALVLHAVAARLPVERFVLHDPPYSPPDEEPSQEEARRFALEIRDLLGQDKRAEAIGMTFRGTGMPDDMIAEMRTSPRWPALIALAPTLAYDSAVMGDIDRGGAIPEDLAARATQPGLVLVGSESPPFMMEVSRRLADLLPDGDHRVIEGQDHVVAPDVLAPIVDEFLRR